MTNLNWVVLLLALSLSVLEGFGERIRSKSFHQPTKFQKQGVLTKRQSFYHFLPHATNLRSTIDSTKWIELQPKNVRNLSVPDTDRGEKKKTSFRKEAFVLSNPQPIFENEDVVNHLLNIAHSRDAIEGRHDKSIQIPSTSNDYYSSEVSGSQYSTALSKTQVPYQRSGGMQPVEDLEYKLDSLKSRLNHTQKGLSHLREMAATQRSSLDTPIAKYALRRLYDNQTSKMISKGILDPFEPMRDPTVDSRTYKGMEETAAERLKEFKDSHSDGTSKEDEGNDIEVEPSDGVKKGFTSFGIYKHKEKAKNKQKKKSKKLVDNQDEKNEESDSEIGNVDKSEEKVKNKRKKPKKVLKNQKDGQNKESDEEAENVDKPKEKVKKNPKKKPKKLLEKGKSEEQDEEADNVTKPKGKKKNNSRKSEKLIAKEKSEDEQNEEDDGEIGSNNKFDENVRNKQKNKFKKLLENEKGEDEQDEGSDEETEDVAKPKSKNKNKFRKSKKGLENQITEEEQNEENYENTERVKPNRKVKNKFRKSKYFYENESEDEKNEESDVDEDNAYEPKEKVKRKFKKSKKLIESQKNEDEHSRESESESGEVKKSVDKPKGKVKHRSGKSKKVIETQESQDEQNEESGADNDNAYKPKEKVKNQHSKSKKVLESQQNQDKKNTESNTENENAYNPEERVDYKYEEPKKLKHKKYHHKQNKENDEKTENFYKSDERFKYILRKVKKLFENEKNQDVQQAESDSETVTSHKPELKVQNKFESQHVNNEESNLETENSYKPEVKVQNNSEKLLENQNSQNEDNRESNSEAENAYQPNEKVGNQPDKDKTFHENRKNENEQNAESNSVENSYHANEKENNELMKSIDFPQNQNNQNEQNVHSSSETENKYHSSEKDIKLFENEKSQNEQNLQSNSVTENRYQPKEKEKNEPVKTKEFPQNEENVQSNAETGNNKPNEKGKDEPVEVKEFPQIQKSQNEQNASNNSESIHNQPDEKMKNKLEKTNSSQFLQNEKNPQEQSVVQSNAENKLQETTTDNFDKAKALLQLLKSTKDKMKAKQEGALPLVKQPGESISPAIAQEIAKEKQPTGGGLASFRTFSYDPAAINGPHRWYLTNPFCKGGKQSPINIDTNSVIQDQIVKNIIIKQTKQDAPLSGFFKNNGHSPTFSLSEASAVRLMGGGLQHEYYLKQIHFHFGCDATTGSEHLLNGMQYPLEMHMVFWDKFYKTFGEAAKGDRGIAVIAVLFQLKGGDGTSEEMTPLNEISKLLENIKEEGNKVIVPEELNLRLKSLLPITQSIDKANRFYTYEGSLTTPACYQSVVWFVYDYHPLVTEKQLNAFRKLKSTKVNAQGTMCNNYRPKQETNGRKIYSNII